jgi:hypothetical protein
MLSRSKRLPVFLLILGLAAILIVGIPVLASIFQLPIVAPASVPPDARIVYLTNNIDAPASDLTSAARVTQALGAQPVNSWNAVLEADQASPIDAIIIDASALSMVDKSWASYAYRRGTVIAGFNISGSEMANLLSDPCIAAGNFANDDSGSFFLVVSRTITGSSEDIGRVETEFSSTCGERGAEGVQGTTSLNFRRTTERLESDNTFNIFTQILASHLD